MSARVSSTQPYSGDVLATVASRAKQASRRPPTRRAHWTTRGSAGPSPA